ncbi:MAG: 4'-phosphopantetheinyl transferase family protein [Gemmatimonadota bacterium]
MPVGNDVVDLRDPDNQPAALHPRFDERVFGPEERDLLAAAAGADPRHRLRWTMWAAKESALKYLRQLDPELPFHPREFVVRLDSPAAGRVEHHGTGLAVTIDATPARVHAVTLGAPGEAGSAESNPVTRTGTAQTQSGTDASDEVRRLAAIEIARLLGLEPSAVQIDGSVGAAPRARADTVLLPVELSLSHDGTWLAWAVVASR